VPLILALVWGEAERVEITRYQDALGREQISHGKKEKKKTSKSALSWIRTRDLPAFIGFATEQDALPLS
jgi:hypothetical protein